MDVILIGNTQPAVALGEPDDDGNVRVAVFGGEQYVPAHDLYNVDGSQAFANKDTAQADDQLANAQTQPPTAPGA